MNSPIRNLRPRTQGAIPNIIFILLVANGMMFALQQLSPAFTRFYLALWPMTDFAQMSYEQFLAYWPRGVAPFMPWQLVTYGFLHGNLTHIFFNMFGLWMFGRELEGMMGQKRFLTYYFTCVIGAGLVQLLVAGTQDGLYPTVGASGGVFGILLAYGMAFPNRMVMLMFPPIPMKAKYFVIMLGLFELSIGFSGVKNGIANFAHLGGMLFGFVLIKYWGRQRRG